MEYRTMSDNLRSRIIRLAAVRPDLRSHLLPLIATQDKVAARPLHEIAREIRRDWKPVDYSAKPYLEAMGDLSNIDDKYGEDDGKYIVNYFLSNSGKWRGDVAKRVKAELKQMVGRRASKEACGWDGGESDTMGCGEGTVMAKFEEGKPADPTENMSPADAAEWKKQNAIHKDQFKSAGRRTASALRMISDPGHGWLEVPVSELARLGIANQISRYSYRKGQMAYLEEDSDAGKYLEALEAAGEPRPMISEVYQERTPIRNYPSYR